MLVFIVRVFNRVWAKNANFTHKKAGKDACAVHILAALGAWVCSTTHALGAWYVFAML